MEERDWVWGEEGREGRMFWHWRLVRVAVGVEALRLSEMEEERVGIEVADVDVSVDG